MRITVNHKPVPLLPDDPMYAEAVAAMKRYHESQAAGLPADEVERLRQIAESQFQAVTEYQLRALGKDDGTIH